MDPPPSPINNDMGIYFERGVVMSIMDLLPLHQEQTEEEFAPPTCLSTGAIPTTGFQGLLSNRVKASPPTRFRLEWIICSTSTGHCEGGHGGQGIEIGWYTLWVMSFCGCS